MAAPILTQMPDEIRSGTTVEYLRTLSDYPPSGWTLAVSIAGPTLHTPATVTVVGTDFKVAFSAAITGGLLPGNYQWIERVAEIATSKVYDAAVGQVLVLRDVSIAAAGDAQTWEEKTLAVVEGVLSGRATADMEAYSIAGRSVSKIPVKELRAWREWLKYAVASQRNPGTIGRTIQAYFPNEMRP